MTTKADMHVHSIYSEHPSEWFLQRIGAGESYSEPEHIYRMAKQRGMDFVTITDHNRIEGALKLVEKHPEDTFTGVESTAYFPEDGCKVHILIYGFTEKEFKKIQKHRKNIYDLRDYLGDTGLPHSVAHADYSVNGKLKLEHIEKLILMFDVFEGINGGRSSINNQAIQDVVASLDPKKMLKLYDKYGIMPFSMNSWEKGYSAGSDDHAGLFVGKTYAIAENARTPEDFLIELKGRRLKLEGRNNNYTSLAFMIYKIAWDYSISKSEKFGKNAFSSFNQLLFEPKSLSIMNKIKLKGLNITVKNDDIISKKIFELIAKLNKYKEEDPDSRFELVYDTVSNIIDEIIRDIVNYFTENLEDLNLMGAFSKISSVLPAVFLTMPFISSFNHLFGERELIREMRKSFGLEEETGKKRILWFTDTINDMNGVSMNLQEVASLANTQDIDITIAASFDENEKKDVVPNILELPSMYSFKLPYYDSYSLKVPSFLDSLKKIYEFNPHEIYISTPGFVGMLGMIAAKLLHIPSYGIFHTDFQMQTDAIADDDSLNGLLESYMKWFYNSCDFIAAPTKEYLNIMESYGFDKNKFKLYQKWIDTDLFKPIDNSREFLQKEYGINGAPILLFTGRISKDKHIDSVVEIHEKLMEKGKENYLFIVGEGPYYEQLKRKNPKLKNIIFTGRKDRKELAKFYSGSDLFVFPSDSDTFGMSVMEAQACGLPCIVSDKGGPQEIVVDDKSGFVIPSKDINAWIEKVEYFINLREKNSPEIDKLKAEAISNIQDKYALNTLMSNLIIDTEV